LPRAWCDIFQFIEANSLRQCRVGASPRPTFRDTSRAINGIRRCVANKKGPVLRIVRQVLIFTAFPKDRAQACRWFPAGATAAAPTMFFKQRIHGIHLIILPSGEMVTMLRGISLPLSASAFFTAKGSPPQQGTVIRATVMLRISLLAKSCASFWA